MQDKVGSRDDILVAVLLRPIGSLGQGQVALPCRAPVALVQGGLEGVLPAEPLLCFACLLLVQSSSSAVLVQLTQWAGLQKKRATSAGLPCRRRVQHQRTGLKKKNETPAGQALQKKSATPAGWPEKEELCSRGLACRRRVQHQQGVA